MKIFLAGAGGAMGRKLTPLLRAVGHTVIGTTRSADKANGVRALGAEPVVVDVFDADALTRAVTAAAPDAIIHQLTDLPFAPGTPQYEEGIARNVRLRVEGTRNLVAAALAADVKRMVAQSIAFAYAPADGMRVESDPLNVGVEGVVGQSAQAAAALEQAVLGLPEGIVLRFGYFYGPGTWYDTPTRAPSVHIEAAARAAMQALTKGKPGIYNVAEDGPAVSSEKAKQDFGFDPQGRIRMRS
jgi:nucleoside-diphosphate-sugar epimerase